MKLSQPILRRRRSALLALLLAGLLFWTFQHFITGFLAIVRPISGEVLVLEAWFPDSPIMEDAAATFLRGHYQKLICVATDDTGEAGPASPPSAIRAAERLNRLGVPADSIQTILVPNQQGHRTYHCAVAVSTWLKRERPSTRSMDLFTIGTHARKSFILYQKAFPSEIAVGVIAGKVQTDYPLSCWWLSRRGTYVTLRNTIGYLYALAYYPPADTRVVFANPPSVPSAP